VENVIINLSHYKGGVGKTTLATNLAIALGASILDLDGQQSSVLFNRLRAKNGHKPIECFTAESVEDMKVIFRQFTVNKMLIIDSGGYDSDINRFAMLSADMLITPVSPSQVEIFGLQKYEIVLKQISEKYGRQFKTNVVINNADVRSKGAIMQLKKFISIRSSFDLFSTIINSRADYKKAYGEGVSVVELDANSKATDEINSFVREIRKELGNGN
jgi:chromosome partitioning protein